MLQKPIHAVTLDIKVEAEARPLRHRIWKPATASSRLEWIAACSFSYPLGLLFYPRRSAQNFQVSPTRFWSSLVESAMLKPVPEQDDHQAALVRTSPNTLGRFF